MLAVLPGTVLARAPSPGVLVLPPRARAMTGSKPWVLVRWDIMRVALRQRRRALGLRASDVSERMGRSPGYIGTLENRPDGAPTLAVLLEWIEALDGDLSIVWREEEG